MNKISESIFNGKNVVIPMADVQHIEKQYHNIPSADGTVKKGDLSGIMIITKHTTWDMVADQWSNNIWISTCDGQAQEFIKAWTYYRYELEGGKERFYNGEGK